MDSNYEEMATTAAAKGWSHQEYFEHLIRGETDLRWDNAIQRRIRMARFPVIKTLDQFNWTWPKKINRLQVQQLFRLQLVKQASNVIFIGGVGVTYLEGDKLVLAPIRSGVGLRLGANIGYLKYTRQPTWNPF